jgi:hypothetical protein
MVSTLHFSGWNFMSQFDSHSASLSRPCCRFAASAKVSHSLIIHKLKHYGITGKTNEWIKNLLSDRTQSVVVEGVTSTSMPVESGVLQGSVLGPSLFLFYISFPWSRFLVTSSINSISCDSQDNPLWNPCWSGYMMFCVFAWDIIWLVMICSMSLHETQVRDTGL